MLLEGETISLSKYKEPTLSISTSPISGKVQILVEVDDEDANQYLHLLEELFKTRNSQSQHIELFARLTIREREICKLITKGYMSEQIAQLLYISCETVKTHRKNILRKFGCKRLQELMQYDLFFY